MLISYLCSSTHPLLTSTLIPTLFSVLVVVSRVPDLNDYWFVRGINTTQLQCAVIYSYTLYNPCSCLPSYSLGSSQST